MLFLTKGLCCPSVEDERVKEKDKKASVKQSFFGMGIEF